MPTTKTEASSLLFNIIKFEFIVMIRFWYKVLTKIDIVNKICQIKDMMIVGP